MATMADATDADVAWRPFRDLDLCLRLRLLLRLRLQARDRASIEEDTEVLVPLDDRPCDWLRLLEAT